MLFPEQNSNKIYLDYVHNMHLTQAEATPTTNAYCEHHMYINMFTNLYKYGIGFSGENDFVEIINKYKSIFIIHASNHHTCSCFYSLLAGSTRPALAKGYILAELFQ